MSDEKQIALYTDRHSDQQVVCEKNDLGEGCSGELIQKSDGSAEYEKARLACIEKNYPEALKWATLSADLGNMEALLKLGWMYRRGNAALEKSFEMAKKYYSQAAALGSTKAEYWLGFLHQHWKGPEKDLSTAIYHYTQSVDSEADSAFYLGLMYRDGEGVNKDHSKAAYYLEKSAAMSTTTWDIAYSLSALSKIYCYGQNRIEKNYEKALSYANLALNTLEEIPKQKNIDAIENSLSQSSMCIINASITEKNYAEAYKFATKILEFKNPEKLSQCTAAQKLGSIYYEGLGFEKNFAQSFHYYEIASNVKSGNEIKIAGLNIPIISFLDCAEESKVILGQMYFIGRGVEKDIKKAFELLENANPVIPIGHNTLCAIYANGYEVKRDLNKAIHHCEKGQEKNQCNIGLGVLYYHTNQYEKALPCLKTAAEQENRYAAYFLSLMHIDGSVVGRDFSIAREWASKAGTDQNALLYLIEHTIPTSLEATPNIVSYSCKANVELLRLSGTLGLTHEEEKDLFGQPHVAKGEEILLTFSS